MAYLYRALFLRKCNFFLHPEVLCNIAAGSGVLSYDPSKREITFPQDGRRHNVPEHIGAWLQEYFRCNPAVHRPFIELTTVKGQLCSIKLYTTGEDEGFAVRFMPRSVWILDKQVDINNADHDLFFTLQCTKMVEYSICPHFLLCSGFYAHSHAYLKCPFDDTPAKPRPGYVTIMEKGRFTLLEMLRCLTPTDEVDTTVIITFFFQILFTLHTLRLQWPGFVHSDLHLNNIMVLPIPRTLFRYQVGDQVICIPTSYCLQIMDFGLSYCDTRMPDTLALPALPKTYYTDVFLSFVSIQMILTNRCHNPAMAEVIDMDVIDNFISRIMPVQLRAVNSPWCFSEPEFYHRLKFDYDYASDRWINLMNHKEQYSAIHLSLADMMSDKVFEEFYATSPNYCDRLPTCVDQTPLMSFVKL